jgi:protein-L-isoaspartate O-methyltransferase
MGVDPSEKKYYSSGMKLLASEELAANPRKLLDQLAREGSLVLTENGHPKGILVATTDETFAEDIQAQVRARAGRALSEIRREAARRGVDRLTFTEIDREIAAVRKARRARSPK